MRYGMWYDAACLVTSLGALYVGRTLPCVATAAVASALLRSARILLRHRVPRTYWAWGNPIHCLFVVDLLAAVAMLCIMARNDITRTCVVALVMLVSWVVYWCGCCRASCAVQLAAHLAGLALLRQMVPP